MKLAILGPLSRSYEEIRLLEEATKRFSSVSYFPIPQVVVEMEGESFKLTHKNKNLLDYDVILPRMPRSYKTFGTTLLHFLNKAGKSLPIEPWAVVASHNKFLTLAMLQEGGIPIPETYMGLKRGVVEDVLSTMNYPAVLKLLYGSMGVGVMFADSKQSAISIIDAMERFNEPIFVEDFIPPGNVDIRAYVINGKVVASMKRIAKEDERRANIGMGGEGHVYKLTSKEKKLALKSAELMGCKICGVDIMPSPDGPVVIETNVNAQFKGIEKATKKNIAGNIIDFLARGV
ncbi:MAG: RimK family alpha-L-glutamate ligase [Candidatus Altiarchaeota archaeon]|nr:RimK family alpha-L-glutamate ligase [Candidatus Altiarchaeota archaeon]